MSPEEYKILQKNIDAKKLKHFGGTPTLVEKVATVNRGVQKSTRKGSKAKGEMELVIKGLFPNYKKEFAFAEGRRYRFDFYLPEQLCGIEYEGVYVSEGEHSGHTNMNGYAKDCEKYNLAQILGYKVLRYTNKNYHNLGSDLWQLKYGVTSTLETEK